MSFMNDIATLVAPERIESFRAWMGGEMPVVEPYGDGLPESGGFVIRAWHGTTHEFTRFDPFRMRPTGYFGAMAYFTTSEEDAWRNYTDKSADLGFYIESYAESLIQSDDCDMTMEEALAEARGKLLGATPRVIEFFIRTTKPCIVSPGRRLSLDGEEISIEEISAQLHGRFAAEMDAASEMGESEEDEVWERYDEAVAERTDDIDRRLQEIVRRAVVDAGVSDWTTQDVEGEIRDLMMGAESVSAFVKGFHQNDSIFDALRDDMHESVRGDVLSRILRGMGYDSIIMPDADRVFPHMGIESGTAHVHVFSDLLAAAKSVDSLRFDPDDPDFT